MVGVMVFVWLLDRQGPAWVPIKGLVVTGIVVFALVSPQGRHPARRRGRRPRPHGSYRDLGGGLRTHHRSSLARLRLRRVLERGEGPSRAVFRIAQTNTPHSHNGFLDLVLGLGLLGLAFYVVVMGVDLSRAVANVRQSDGARQDLSVRPLLAGDPLQPHGERDDGSARSSGSPSSRWPGALVPIEHPRNHPDRPFAAPVPRPPVAVNIHPVNSGPLRDGRRCRRHRFARRSARTPTHEQRRRRLPMGLGARSDVLANHVVNLDRLALARKPCDEWNVIVADGRDSLSDDAYDIAYWNVIEHIHIRESAGFRGGARRVGVG